LAYVEMLMKNSIFDLDYKFCGAY